MFETYSKVKEFIKKNERYISPAFLFSGFIVDNLTLRRIDLLAENIVIIVYLLIAGICILYLNYFDTKKLTGLVFEKVALFTPLAMQFAFGGLFSVFVVFYSRSASVVASWPFLLFLLVLLIGNEKFQEHYSRLTFQLSVYFVAIFSYSVFAVPIFLKTLGAMVFLLSGIMSLMFIGLVIFILYKITPEDIKNVRNYLLYIIGVIYISFNILYFANIIPPIPLSLIDSGLYHSVVRSGNNYIAEYEPAPWYFIFDNIDPVFHWKSGTAIYSYSAVFAPTKISTDIFHRWSYYDESLKKWVVKDTLEYPIVGGRDGGYRGYTFKYGVTPGKWRVDVITKRGQVLGRKTFRVVKVEDFPKLKQEEK